MTISTGGLTLGLLADLGQGKTLWLTAGPDTRAVFEAARCQRFTYQAPGKARSPGCYSAPDGAMESAPRKQTPESKSMIEALISGRLQGQRAQKLARTGKPYVTAKVRMHAGDADMFIDVIAFSEAACAALLALGSSDAVALAGTLAPKAWIDKEGAARPALDRIASQVLTACHVARKRRALEPKLSTSASAPAGKEP